MARALGSYPGGRWFKSDCRYHFWPVGQEVKTSPFHGGNMGSIPVRVTIGYALIWLYKPFESFFIFPKFGVVHYLYIVWIFGFLSPFARREFQSINDSVRNLGSGIFH